MTTPHPDDNYVTPSVNRDALLALARRAAAGTGNPQRLHDHAPGERRCGDGCQELEA